MSKDSTTLIKYLWLLLAGACLIIPLIFITSDNLSHGFHAASEEMMLGMFIISFPSNLLFIPLIIFFDFAFSVYEFPFAFYLLAWCFFFIAGFAQWCWLFPRLMKKAQFTTLGLTELKIEKRSKKRRRRKRARLKSQPVSHFDTSGRTPLGRVFDNG